MVPSKRIARVEPLLQAYPLMGHARDSVSRGPRGRWSDGTKASHQQPTFPSIPQVGRANAFKSRIEKHIDSTPVGLAFIARSSTKKEDEEEEVHKHCIGDVRG